MYLISVNGIQLINKTLQVTVCRGDSGIGYHRIILQLNPFMIRYKVTVLYGTGTHGVIHSTGVVKDATFDIRTHVSSHFSLLLFLSFRLSFQHLLSKLQLAIDIHLKHTITAYVPSSMNISNYKD